MDTRNRTATRATIAMLLLAVLVFSFSYSSVSPVSALTVPREQTLWAAGYWPTPTSFVPYLADDGQGWDTYMMYEPMFGTNVANGSLIKWLGQDIQWINSTCIEITLRSGIKWSDGSAITADDVIYTFKLFEQQGKPSNIAGLITRVGPIADAFQKVSDTKLRVYILPAYADSQQVYRLLTYGFLIVPKAVWTLINASKYDATEHMITGFANDWSSAGFDTTWKIASGMFLPYWHDTITTIMQRNENWWGKTVFGRGAAPKYFGYTAYATNPLVVYALENGDLDWDGSYVPGLDVIMAEHPFIHTYFKNAPYFPDKSTLLLVPNNNMYPLNQSWLHKALTTVMDYNAFSTVCSGYLKTPSVMLLANDDAIARTLLNTTIEAKYAITTNSTHGLEILYQYCDQASDGVWWTKVGPPGDPTHHYPLAKWDKATNRTYPWQLIDISGWTDVNAVDTYAANQITTLLGIKVQTLFLSWGSYLSQLDSMTFDLADYCMHAGLNANMYERYSQFFTGAPGAWNHYGNYVNSTLVGLLDQLDIGNATVRQETANKIQEIIGQEVPLIPMAGHPDWYIYSTKYWTNWANESTNLLAASPYGGGTQEAQLHAVVFALQAVPGAGAGAPVDYTIFIVVGAVVVVAIVAVAAVLLRRKPGK